MKQLWFYPIPIFAALGLLVGAVVRFAFHNPAIAEWIWYGTLAIGGLPIVYKTVKGMLKGEFASDVVAMLAIVTALFMGQAFAGAVIVLMQSGGEALENYGFRRASSSLEKLLERAPRFAFRKLGDRIERIDIGQIQIGDVLVVRSGDLVPADGTIVEGASEIDESAMTGEPLAHGKTVGGKVLSGTVAVNGTFEMRADKLALDSQYAKIVALVRKAQAEKAPIQRLADRYAVFFTPLTLIMAAIGFLATRDPVTILAVLVVATPCPLILATPLAVMGGINRAAELGIIVKGGTPMEQVGYGQAIVFDKTGTITFGTPFVEEIIPMNDEPVDQLLLKAAMIEQMSSHSVAKAIVNKGLEKFGTLPLPTHSEEVPGCGVKGTVDGDEFLIGSRSFVGCESYPQKDKLLIFVSKNNKCIGVFVLSDRVRPGISAMVQTLSTMGVQEIVMLTGDSKGNGAMIAKQSGIENVESELLPLQKAETIQKLQKTFDSVIMVGDGINDAPALATATVGIAMGAYGSAISAETADIVLLEDDPTKVVDAIIASRHMLRIAKQSIFIGMTLSFILMIIACCGVIQPAVGALLQEIIDVAVILNALRAR